MTSADPLQYKTLPPPWDRIFSLGTRLFVWALLVAVLYVLRPFFLLIFLTFVFAYIQAHGVDGLGHRIRNRPLRVVIVGLVFLGTLFATGFTLAPQVREQAEQFLRHKDKYIAEADHELNKFLVDFPSIYSALAKHQETFEESQIDPRRLAPGGAALRASGGEVDWTKAPGVVPVEGPVALPPDLRDLAAVRHATGEGEGEVGQPPGTTIEPAPKDPTTDVTAPRDPTPQQPATGAPPRDPPRDATPADGEHTQAPAPEPSKPHENLHLVRELVAGIGKSLTENPLQIGQSVLSFASSFLLSLLFSFLIVLDLPQIRRGIRGLADTKVGFIYYEVADSIATFGRVLGRALEAQLFIAVCNTILTALGIWLLDLPNMLVLSAIVFFCSFIPVVGTFISSTPICLLALQGGGVSDMLLAILLITVIHLFETYVLNPQIYGHHMHMNPVLVLIVLTIGGKLFGIWGLVLGIPIVNYFFRHAIRHTDHVPPVPPTGPPTAPPTGPPALPPSAATPLTPA